MGRQRVWRALTRLALLAGLSGCLRFGYRPVADSPRGDAAADGADAGSDAGDAESGAADAGANAPADAAVTRACGGEPMNACGGCAVLPFEPSSACGGCGLGQYVCNGPDAVTCVGGTTTPSTTGEALLIDDFEDGDRRFHSGPIIGDWYLVRDGTKGSLNPPTTDALVPTSPGARDSAGALHVSGSGFTNWGAGFQGVLNLSGCYVSAAAQKGVGFYARGSGTVTFSVATKQTVPTSEGGSCSGTCNDYFMTTIALTNTWTPYSIEWSTLHQSGWGTPATFEAIQIKLLQFSFAADSSMDLYLDDVRLY